jgi:hypothetical protein
MRKPNPRYLRIWIPDARNIDTPGSVKHQSTMSNKSFWRALWYLVLPAALAMVTVLYTLTWSQGVDLKSLGLVQGWNTVGSIDLGAVKTESEEGEELLADVHPMQHLMTTVSLHFEGISKHETHTLDQGAAQYRKRRGRHPPHGFPAWHAHATTHNGTINERFWDQI